MRYRLAWVLIVLIYLGARYQNLPGVFTGHGTEVNDTDPYYRLHRIEKIVHQNWVYPLHDPDLSFPNGFDVPWPTGLDYILAVPLKLFHAESKATIEIFSSIMIPILSLPILWAMGVLGHITLGPVGGLAAGFLISVLPPVIYSSAVGRLDHHFLEVMFTAFALLLLAYRQKENRFKFWFLLAILLGWGPAFWPQAWVLSLFAALSLFIDRNFPDFEKSSKLFASASLLSLLPLATSARFQIPYVSIYGFSWWSPILYALLACFFSAFHWKKRIPVFLYTLALLLPYLLRNAGGWFKFVATQAVHAAAGSGGLLGTTSEATATILFPIHRWPDLGLIPFVLTWIWFGLQAFRRERWWLLGFFLGPLLLSAMQARFVPLGSSVMVLGSVFLILDVSRKMAPDESNALLLCGLLTLGLAIPSLPRFEFSERGNQHPLFIPTKDLALFLHKRDERLHLSPNDRAIAAHWDLGHWFLYYGDLPVVSHPFQDSTAIDSIHFFCSEKDDEFDSYVKKYPVRYMLFETPTERINKWLEVAGKNPASYIHRPGAEGDPKSDLVKDPFYKLLLARFFLGGGIDAKGELMPHWRLIYVSPFAFYGKPGPPALKLFEHVKGARIQARSDGPLMDLTAEIKTADGSISFRQKGKWVGQNLQEWVFPYGKTGSGGVLFDGSFLLEKPDKRKIRMNRIISDEDVLQGHLIDLGTIR